MKPYRSATSTYGFRSGIPGFTLIELLVTIGIIGVLAVLLVPSVARALDSSRSAECTSNLRQIGSAFFLYLPDHNNTLPQRVYEGADVSPGVRLGYDELIASYMDNSTRIFRCPSHAPRDYLAEPSYGMNWYYDNANVSVVENRSGTILAAETVGSSGRGSHRADRDSEEPGQLASGRHLGKANYLFFDGHIERLTHDQTLDPEDRWGEDQEMHDQPPPETL